LCLRPGMPRMIGSFRRTHGGIFTGEAGPGVCGGALFDGGDEAGVKFGVCARNVADPRQACRELKSRELT
jgi:hypothetical protein